MHTSRWIQIGTMTGPPPSTESAERQSLHDLEGLVCVGRGDLGKGGPPVHPKLFLPQEGKDITKMER